VLKELQGKVLFSLQKNALMPVMKKNATQQTTLHYIFSLQKLLIKLPSKNLLLFYSLQALFPKPDFQGQGIPRLPSVASSQI